MAGLSWTLSLNDKISSEASHIASSLDKVKKSMSETGKASKLADSKTADSAVKVSKIIDVTAKANSAAVEKEAAKQKAAAEKAAAVKAKTEAMAAAAAKKAEADKAKAVALAQAKQKAQIEKATKEADAVRKRSAELAEKEEEQRRSGMISGGKAAILAVGAAAAIALAMGAVAAGKAVYGMVQFREANITAFTALGKTKLAATQTYEEAMKLAEASPFKSADVMSTYQGLSKVGFEAKELSSLFKLVGDASASAGEGAGERMGQLVGMLGELKQAGSAALGEGFIDKLKEAGVSTKLFEAKLASMKGVSSEKIGDLIKSGAITGTEGLSALKEVLREQFSGGMREASTSLSGIVNRITEAPTRLLSTAMGAEGGASGLSRLVGMAKGGAGALADMLSGSSATGKQFLGLINQISDSITGAFSAAGFGSFEGTLSGVLSVLSTMTSYVTTFGKALMGALGPTLTALFGTLSKGAAPVKSVLEFMTTAGSYVGTSLSTAIRIIVSLGSLIGTTFSTVAPLLGAALPVIASVGSAFASMVEVAVAVLTPVIEVIGKIIGKVMELGSALMGALKGIPGVGKALDLIMPSKGPGGFGLLDLALGGKTATAAPPMPTMPAMPVPVSGVGIGLQTQPPSIVQAPAAKTENHYSFSASVSGAGLTPDQIVARCRQEMKSMFDQMKAGA